MVEHGHADGDVGIGQEISCGVRNHDWDVENLTLRRAQIDTLHLNPQIPLNGVEKCAVATTDIEYAADGARVTP
jgi:hypothetical protein